MKITVREILPYTFKSGGLFLLTIIMSYIYAYFTPEKANQLTEAAAQSAQAAMNDILIYEAWNIFSHNLYVSIIMILFGATIAFLFKIQYGAYILLMLNGAIIGTITYVEVQRFGLVIFLLLIMIHGIVELPTVFFSAGLGIMIGTRIAKREFDKEALISSLKILVFIIVPLYAVSAIIEVFVTGGIIVPLIKQAMSLA